MAIKRRRYDSESANAAGIDYLLRRAARMTTEPLVAKVATGGYVFEGPIEPTFLVASVDARPALRAVADFVCDGINDEEEIQYALELLPSTGGCVVLSEGRFSMGVGSAAVTIVVPANGRLQGKGIGVTQLTYSSPLFDLQITYGADSELSDFSIVAVGGCPV